MSTNVLYEPTQCLAPQCQASWARGGQERRSPRLLRASRSPVLLGRPVTARGGTLLAPDSSPRSSLRQPGVRGNAGSVEPWQQETQAFRMALPNCALAPSSLLRLRRSAFDISSWHECVKPAKATACWDCVTRRSSRAQAPDSRSTVSRPPDKEGSKTLTNTAAGLRPS